MTEPENKSLTTLLDKADADLLSPKHNLDGQSIRLASQNRKTNHRIQRAAIVLVLLSTSTAIIYTFVIDETTDRVVESTRAKQSSQQTSASHSGRSEEPSTLLADAQALQQIREELELQIELNAMKRRLAKLNRERALWPVIDKYDVIQETNTIAYSMLLSVTDSLNGPISETTRPKLKQLIEAFPNTSAAEVANRMLAQY